MEIKEFSWADKTGKRGERKAVYSGSVAKIGRGKMIL